MYCGSCQKYELYLLFSLYSWLTDQNLFQCTYIKWLCGSQNPTQWPYLHFLYAVEIHVLTGDSQVHVHHFSVTNLFLKRHKQIIYTTVIKNLYTINIQYKLDCPTNLWNVMRNCLCLIQLGESFTQTLAEKAIQFPYFHFTTVM